MMPEDVGKQSDPPDSIRKDAGKLLQEREGANRTFADITENRQAEEGLQDAVHQWETTFNAITDSVMLLDSEHRILRCNDATLKLLGKEAGEIVGHHCWELVHGTSKPIDGCPLVRMSKTLHRETVLLPLGGRWFEVAADPILDHAGRLTRSVHIISDITEHKRMEEALRKSEVKYRTLIDQSPEGIVIAQGPPPRLVFANPAMAKILGYTPDELTSLSPKETEGLVHPEDRAVFFGRFSDRLQGKPAPSHYEVRGIRKDGQVRWLEISSNRIEDQGQPAVQATFVDITERKRMQDELQRHSTQLEELVLERTKKLADSERRFRETADLLPQIVFEIDGNGNLQYMNRAASAAIGLGEEDFRKGLNAFQMFAQEDHERARQGIQRTLTGETIGGREFTALRRDGTTFPVLVHTAPMMREGKTVGVRGIAIDITDRKRSEEKILAAGKRLEYLITANPAIIFTGKPRGDLSDYDATYMSESVVQATGFEPKELIANQRFWESRLHPDDLRHYSAELPRFWKEGHHVFEYRFLHKDGTYRWLREEARLIRDASDKPQEVMGFWTDVTERRKMENALRESEERLRRLLESMSEHIAVFDSEWRYLLANDALTRSVRIPKEQLLGKKLTEVLPGIEKSMFYEAGERVMKSHQPATVDDEYIFEDGRSGWFESHIYPVPEGIMYITIDITERKQMERALLKSQRLAAIGELAGMVGHDLRNPLQGIVGSTYNLRAKGSSRLSKEGKKILDLIDEAVRRSDKIISDLQEYSAEIRLELRESDAKSITRDALGSVKIPKKIHVANSAKSQPKIMLDTDRMRRVLLNLIRNAVDAMPNGGTLTIASRQTKGNLQITIRDTGEGMTPKTVAKLWNPLFTTKAKGMGFGLPIAKRFVEAHEGCISIETKPGKGSTFTMTLPIKPNLEEVKKR